METVYAQDQKAFTEAIEAIRPGDCVRIDSISAVSDSAKAFLPIVTSRKAFRIPLGYYGC